jgi:hypothetical protein
VKNAKAASKVLPADSGIAIVHATKIKQIIAEI